MGKLFWAIAPLALLTLLLAVLFVLLPPPVAQAAPAASPYVGSAKCAECHQTQYDTFQKNSKKAQSWRSVSIMAPKLTPTELEGCYTCHTTGYNKGGFVDYKTTPHLSDVGCETCHGAGAAHADGGDPSLIQRKPEYAACTSCHDANRTKSFKRTPLTYSGAH